MEDIFTFSSLKGTFMFYYAYIWMIYSFLVALLKISKNKKFLASNFTLKDLDEVDVILGIKIINLKMVVLTQTNNLSKVHKKFIHFNNIWLISS